MIKKYVIATATTPEELGKIVNGQILGDLQPYGSPFVLGSLVCQAMVLEAEDEEVETVAPRCSVSLEDFTRPQVDLNAEIAAHLQELKSASAQSVK